VLFTGDVSDRLRFVTGMHWMEDENQEGKNCLDVLLANWEALRDPEGDAAVPCFRDGGTQFELLGDKQELGGPVVTGMAGYIRQESIAVFGHMTYDVNDNWTLDFGARYTEDERTYHLVEMGTVDGTCTHTQPDDPPITRLCAPDYIMTYNNSFIDGIYQNSNATFDAWTPMFSATRHLGDNMMYFLYSEGFLSGSFNDSINTDVNPDALPLVPFGPEFVSNYEVGYKGGFLDGRLQLSTAVFFMDYTDKQVEIQIDNTDGRFGPLSTFSVITNAGAVDIYGIELELRAQPWDGGFVSVDLGHLQNEFREFDTFDPEAGGDGAFIDQSNLSINDYSPEWTLNLMVEHAFGLRNGATLTPQVAWNWRDDYEWRGGLEQNAPPSFCFQPSYSRVRARMTYAPPSQAWQAALYGSNITDELYLDFCNTARTGAYDYRYGDPSRWGIEFTYNWGNN
jgi:iron complex outermembrane receptor protein